MLSKRLVVLACIAVILSIVSAPVVHANNIIMADQSCRTQQSSPDTNIRDTSSLTMRTTNEDPPRTYKSWIKFDISELDVSRLETATLTVALSRERTGSNNFDISYVNDDCLDNIDWDADSLTWNNAPGNNTAHIGALDTDKTTLLTTIYLSNGVLGDAFTIDILEVLESDTDGIVQFVFHNSSGLMALATHTHAEEAWRPFIDANMWPKYMAIKPYPATNENDVYQRPVLSWMPGLYLEGLSPKHKIFFSEDFNDVSDGVGGVTQDANNYPAPDSPLDFGKTYYWRVDEANSVSGWDQGVIWSFTVESEGYPLPEKYITATASSNDQDASKTIDGSGLSDDGLHDSRTTNMWLSSSSAPGEAWIQYDFDKPYKLHQMLVWNYNGSGTTRRQYGLKNVTIEHSLDGIHWTPLDNVPVFNQSPGWSGYASDIVVDFNNLMIKQVRITALSNWSSGSVKNQYGLSEVRFLVLPLEPREMSPVDGSTDVDLGVILSWRSGREAETHEVYFGSNPSNLSLAKIVTGVPYAAYDTTEQNLQLGQTYYWQVKEVNTLEIPTTWESDILEFSTWEFLVVDDFESYNDIPEGEEGSNLVYATWTDGYVEPPAVRTNGSTIGYLSVPSMETTTIHDGRQSAPLMYNNSTASISEVTASTTDLAVGSDWTVGAPTVLTLWFYGDPNNAVTEQMYVELNGVKKIYDGDAGDIATSSWTRWDVELASFGISLGNVTSITIGFERIGASGGSGMVLFDDIRLYPSRCILSRRSTDFARFDYVEDCIIDYKELDVIAAEWLTSSSDLTSDLNADNTVDLKDYAALADRWLEQQLWP